MLFHHGIAKMERAAKRQRTEETSKSATERSKIDRKCCKTRKKEAEMVNKRIKKMTKQPFK